LLHVLVGSEGCRGLLNGHANKLDFCSPSPAVAAVWIARHEGAVHLFVDLGSLLAGDVALVEAVLRYREGSRITPLNADLFPQRAAEVAGAVQRFTRVAAPVVPVVPVPAPAAALRTVSEPEPLLTPDELAMLLDDRGLT
jgi:hypothetical protein